MLARFVALVFAACSMMQLSAAPSGTETPVRAGIARTDGEKYDAEFSRYGKEAAFYKEQGIDAALFDYNDFCHTDIAPADLYTKLKRFQVIVLPTHEESVYKLTDQFRQRAENVAKGLEKYVSEGGGLVIQPRSVRYANDEDEKYWNLVFGRFGLKILHEGVFDTTNQAEVEIKPGLKQKFFHTGNIQDNPATSGVKSLWLPLNSYYPNAGTPAMEYSPDWTVLAKGEKSAKSYKSHEQQNIVDLAKEGTYASEPPIVAIRSLGKGRIVCVPVDPIHTGINLGNPSWSHIVENKGDAKSGSASDMMTLMANVIRWAAEPALGNPELGKSVRQPYAPITFPESCAWNPFRNAEKGVIGAHSSYSDGEGTVAKFVEAAKAADLSFVVFTDPLELLTPEKLKSLMADCAKASNGSFYACPGIEFTDGSGVRWIFFGEKVKWPEESFKGHYGGGDFAYPQWDGKVVRHFGKYIEQCNYCPSAVVSYKLLRECGAVPENMWWFYNVIPYAYDGGELIADNFQEWLFALRDLRLVSPVSFTRVKSPTRLADAARLGSTAMKNLPSVRKALNTRCTPYWAAKDATQFTSFGGGVEVLEWEAINDQMEENWQRTRGAQRTKLKFTVRSPNGIKDVVVHDANYGVIRRFASTKGEEFFSREFELTQDKQHYLTLVATDLKGGKAVSSFIFVYCYKQGLYRCGDNLNILGPLGMYWHPDRNQDFHLFKDFRNAELMSVQGWDRGGPDCPVPSGLLCDWVNIKGVGEFPAPSARDRMLGKRMDVRLGSHNLQIAGMRMDSLVERFDNENRPGPSFASIARKLDDNEYFTRTTRMVAPMDRMDHFVAWNFRRYREGIKDYQGSYLWHEGEITFKKDVTLQGRVPIPLAWTSEPFDLARSYGTRLVVADADKGPSTFDATEPGKPLNASGRITPAGYAAVMNCPVGYLGILPGKDMDFAYMASVPGRLYVGLGRDGQEIKAGTVLKYSFLAGDFIDQVNNGDRMAYVSKAFNLGGGTDGYPIEMKVGACLDATFFFTATAEKGEAQFALGPKKEIGIDLPIKVNGLDDNGCAAIYSTVRKWFRFVPVVDGAAYLQEPIDDKNDIWIGNVFLCDNKEIKLTLVVDGQGAGKPPFLEVHNPTDKPVKATISSPTHAPVFGAKKFEIEVPAGSSLVKELE